MSDQVTRRAFLAAAGAAGAAWLVADPDLLHAALVHARRTVALPPPYRFDALTAAQAADQAPDFSRRIRAGALHLRGAAKGLRPGRPDRPE